MKCRVLLAVLFTAFTGIFLPSFGQKTYYVVISSFSTDASAKNLTAHLPMSSVDTAYAIQNEDESIRMYIMKTNDQEQAMARTQVLQNTLAQPAYEISDDASTSRTTALAGGGMAAAPLKPKGKLFKFAVSSPAGDVFTGNVHQVDFEKEQDVAIYPANTYTDILHPGVDRDMTVVYGIFGYKQVEQYIDYSDPSSVLGAYQDENGAWVIPYKLERLEKGDVSVMYNVSFYHDASVMLPQSKTDLDELVKMMKENPNYVIKVHGHCNGKKERRIVAMSGGQPYFETEGSMEVYGSAKLLGSLRADAVKNYLVENGISEKRIKTYSWGGSYKLVDFDSPSSRLNDRIEIEILQD
ncbi:OmpA family protein [Chryseosolibacter indicus]|uniref:OmpA family protein n=1 Tax=Chryseosolibacter indicus TaxID=2782351 RepID=A0ABS5VRV3_9BACT|nr:OmpA family protein [Chryseosolibacter indicus]MBT1703901.1 OmpA family protein [Chryseosolibacter indicus]